MCWPYICFDGLSDSLKFPLSRIIYFARQINSVALFSYIILLDHEIIRTTSQDMAASTPPFYHLSPTRNTRSREKYPWKAISLPAPQSLVWNPFLEGSEKGYNTNQYQHWFYCSFHLHKAVCRQIAPFQPTLPLQGHEEILFLILQRQNSKLPADSGNHKTDLQQSHD